MKLFTNINTIIEHAKSQFGESFSKKTSPEDYISQFEKTISDKYNINELPTEISQQVIQFKSLYVQHGKCRDKLSVEQAAIFDDSLVAVDKTLHAYFSQPDSHNLDTNKKVVSNFHAMNSILKTTLVINETLSTNDNVLKEINHVNKITSGLIEEHQKNIKKEPKM